MIGLADAGRYVRIAGQFARIGVVRKSQFRVDFAFQVVMDCLWYASHVMLFEVLFLHVDAIAGWSRDEVRVFLGFLFVSDAFMMIWLGQNWRFGRDLRDGNLDPVRVRPAHPIFLYFFQQFSLEACLNMGVAAPYLGFALHRAGFTLDLAGGALLLWAVALSLWARLVTVVLFSIAELWLLNSDLGVMLHQVVDAGSDKPIDVFTRRMQLFLLYVVPVAAMTHAPASLVLGRLDPGAGAAYTALVLLLGWATFRFWTWSFRRYESAMG